MSTPTEHKTVQIRILEYTEVICWTIVYREEAEQWRGFDPEAPPTEHAKGRSLYFDNVLNAKVREFNPRYAEGALNGQSSQIHTDLCGNWEFVEHLHNWGKFFDVDAKCECELSTYSNKVGEIYLNHIAPSQLEFL